MVILLDPGEVARYLAGIAAPWICRRDETIRLPYRDIIHRTRDGIPYLAPELVHERTAGAATDRGSWQAKGPADHATRGGAGDEIGRAWLGLVTSARCYVPGHPSAAHGEPPYCWYSCAKTCFW